jgi:hypothetical protein
LVYVEVDIDDLQKVVVPRGNNTIAMSVTGVLSVAANLEGNPAPRQSSIGDPGSQSGASETSKNLVQKPGLPGQDDHVRQRTSAPARVFLTDGSGDGAVGNVPSGK